MTSFQLFAEGMLREVRLSLGLRAPKPSDQKRYELIESASVQALRTFVARGPVKAEKKGRRIAIRLGLKAFRVRPVPALWSAAGLAMSMRNGSDYLVPYRNDFPDLVTRSALGRPARYIDPVRETDKPTDSQILLIERD
jgi:hypothetical protein